MVLHVDGGPHDTVRCYFTTFSHELPVFPYEGRRCSNYYVTGYERAGHAVRKLHTNSGLMHPSASTSNDEKNNYSGGNNWISCLLRASACTFQSCTSLYELASYGTPPLGVSRVY